ncbi:MAG: hypothetical protein KAX44_07705, partial [Candidatus Brocadiae bacterium]|nr:hypothetical protein [Candidatus Brocadiia bacterium]
MATETRQSERAMGHVYRLIDRSRATWRLVDTLDGALKSFIVVGGGLILGFLADNLLHLPGPARMACGVALLGALTFMLLRFVLYPLLRPVTDEMVAAHIEADFPQLDNRVINTVLLAREKFKRSLTRQMVASQIRQTAQHIRDSSLRRPAKRRRLWKSGRWSLALAAVVLLYGALFSEHLANAFFRFVYPYRYIAPITDTRLEVSPGDTDCLQGDSLRIEARVSGVLPESARIHTEDSDGTRTDDTMAFEGNAFTCEFVNVQHDFTYRIKAGDAATRRYTVTVRDRPDIEELELTYHYPDYTGLADHTEENATGDICAPVGTAARLMLKADRPLRSGH